MRRDLNFEAEPFAGYNLSEDEESEEFEKGGKHGGSRHHHQWKSHRGHSRSRHFSRRWPWPYRTGFGVGDLTQDPQSVAWAQGCLSQITGNMIPQDGFMGPATRSAIRMFQMQQQLPRTGRLDDATMAALQDACEPPPSSQSDAPDFPREFDEAGSELYEMENRQLRKGRMLLAFKIPEAPYSDETFKLVHKSLDLVEAVHTTMEIFGVELAGLLGLTVTALAPLAGWVGTFFALGAGYAEGRAEISRERVKSGFALGVVAGADGARWPFAKRLFWKYMPESNPFDEDAGRIAQKAFNTGLATGFLQGQQVYQNPKKAKFFWASIAATFSQGDRTQFGGNPKLWPERQWQDYYIRTEASFIQLYLKE